MDIVNAKFDIEFERKGSHKRSYRPKTFAHINKSKQIHFPVTFFSLITFFA